MKKLLLLFLTTHVFYAYGQKPTADELASLGSIRILDEVEKQINTIAEVDSFRSIKAKSHFKNSYEIWFSQPIDHNDTASKRFPQRVILGHVGFNEPVMVELQGYSIRRTSSYELANYFKANQLIIEHRYFAKSRPDSLDWNKLTTWQAATDQHIVIEKIKTAVYPESKFITTGISKGGQCTLLHNALYPKDAVASVPYVAPLNFAREDDRIYSFLKSVGTARQRNQIETFQKLCLSKKDELVPMLQAKADKKGWRWNLSTEKAFEYYVLEYSFAFWQWGRYDFDEIPNARSSNEEILKHVLAVSGVSFFEESGVEPQRPFFWVAHTEIGLYGYETVAFEKYLGTTEPYLFEFTLPVGTNPPYDPTAVKNVQKHLDTKAENIFCIYGGMDTWSATKVELNADAAKRNCFVYVFEDGHHQTRIKHFPKTERKDILERLEEILEKKVDAY
jgi:hypothetical protein